MTFRFKDFKIYNDAKKFANLCETTLKSLNYKDNLSLINQSRSAYLSIILNIAEGSACKSDKEFARFLEISLRSIYEVVSCFDFAQEMGMIESNSYTNIESHADVLCKQINGFRRYLK